MPQISTRCARVEKRAGSPAKGVFLHEFGLNLDQFKFFLII